LHRHQRSHPYTLAAGRQSVGLGAFCDPRREAVLLPVEPRVKNAHASRIRVGICGKPG
jgi:phosphoenolpyruvate-protein kinase (PTS system EI component)